MARARESASRRAVTVTEVPESPRTTRELLVELAAEVFATEGYATASVRELGRRLGVTSGALYGNFRGKADLLAEAVDARLTADVWALPDETGSKSVGDMVASQFAGSESREQLMSLLLEGALAAGADAEVKQRLHETIAPRIDASSRAFESRREAEGFAADVDLDAAVKMIWSIEIGLRVLSSLGIEPPTGSEGAEVARRFVQGLQGASAAPSDGKKRSRKPAKSVPKKPVSRKRSA